ncbi:MAG: plastocyanin/azurin family copper-binding protein [Candidatus Udaeobacter sp.]
MKIIRESNAISRPTRWLTLLLVMVCLGPAEAGDKAIRIVDQYGRQALSGKRDAGSEVFDVTVGPKANEFTFMPDTVNISVGDTVRWTWASDSHSVTSGKSCVDDGQFCSPDNMNCEAGMLNDTGFVYEFTFTQPGMYQYFCALHCFAGMTGVVNVFPAVRPSPAPRPRPTPWPRP